MQQQDFTKKRQQMSVQIRNNNREQIFSKRRQLETSMDEQSTNEKKKIFIIDERFHTQIQEFSKKHYQFDEPDTLKMFLHLALQEDIIQKHQGFIGIKRTLANSYIPPVQEIIDSNFLPLLFSYLCQSQYPQLKLQSAWIMTNLAAGTTEQCQYIVNAGGIQLAFKLLKENQPGIIEQVIWAIGNIAGDKVSYRDILISMGTIDQLSKIVSTTNKTIQIKNGCWALSNLCRGNPKPSPQKIKFGYQVIANALAKGILDDKEVISECLWVLAYGSEKSQELRKHLITVEGLMHVLFKNLKNPYLGTLLSSLQIIGNLSLGTEEEGNVIIENSFFEECLILIDHPKQAIRREISWILSNIAAGSAQQMSKLISQQFLIKKLMHHFLNDTNTIKREIAWIFANFGFQGNPEFVVKFYIQTKIFALYENFFQVSKDKRDYEEAVNSVHRMLKTGSKCQVDGVNLIAKKLLQTRIVSYIEKLQAAPARVVYQKAIKIMNTYFDVEKQQQ